jgi:serine/threonine protein kinase
VNRDPAPAGNASSAPETVPLAPAGAPRAPVAGPLAIGRELAGRYSVRAELGRGGAGAVYQAFDAGTGLWVAIKVLDPARTATLGSNEHLYRELRMGRSLAHPNVCRTYEVLEADGRCFLVMEYASGGTLRTTLRDRGGGRPLDEKLSDARAVIAGLAAIHGVGLVHRDLKPENILRMADGRLVVSDFGLTRPAEPGTLSTGLAGTPGYLAPEVNLGARSTPASDVWSLGVVLHEILTGERPDGTDGQPTPRLATGAGVEAGYRALARLCLRCLAADPARRPATAVEVESLLDATVSARPTRRRWWAAGAVLGVVSVATAAAILLPRPSAKKAPAPPPAPPIDRGADWSAIPTLPKMNTCVKALPPDGRSVRAFVVDPTWRVIDIELATGRVKPAPVIFEAYTNLGYGLMYCPALSPDGQQLLYTRRAPDGRETIMWSPRPDGKNAVPVTAGKEPRWLGSSKEFLFIAAAEALAIGNLDGQVRLFTGGEGANERIVSAVPDDRGELVAASVWQEHLADKKEGAARAERERESYLQLYDVRTMRYLRRWRVRGEFVGWIDFDPVRRTFLTVDLRGPSEVLVELRNAMELAPVGHIGPGHILAATRTGAGLLVHTYDEAVDRVFVTGPGGSEKSFGFVASPDVSARGDLIYVEASGQQGPMLPGNTRVLLRRAGGPPEPLVLSTSKGLWYPTISPDGKLALYFDLRSGGIFKCDLASGPKATCKLLHTDIDLNFEQRPGPLSPDGDTLPYFASHGNQITADRTLRLLTLRTGQVRDLGQINSRCRPHWTGHTFWVWSATGSERIEFDARTGRPTSRTRPIGPKDVCPDWPGDTKKPYGLRRERGFRWRLVDDRPPPRPG